MVGKLVGKMATSTVHGLLTFLAGASAHPIVDAWRAQSRALDHANDLSLKAPQSDTPKIPEVWSANMRQVIKINGMPVPFAGGEGRYASDSRLWVRRSIQQVGNKIMYAPAEFVSTPLEWLNQTQYADRIFSGVDIENAKYPAPLGGPSGFRDLFSWVRGAKLAGTVSVHGFSYHEWTLTSKFPFEASFRLHTSLDDSVPHAFEENVTL